jgi:hypothetical protein
MVYVRSVQRIPRACTWVHIEGEKDRHDSAASQDEGFRNADNHQYKAAESCNRFLEDPVRCIKDGSAYVVPDSG